MYTYVYIYLWPPRVDISSLKIPTSTHTHSHTVHSNKHLFINHITKVQNMFWDMSCLCEAWVFMKWYLERRFMVHMWNDMTYHHNHHNHHHHHHLQCCIVINWHIPRETAVNIPFLPQAPTPRTSPTHWKQPRLPMWCSPYGCLVGGWTNPFEKYAQVKMGTRFPQQSGWK